MEVPTWSSSLPSGRFDFARGRLALSTPLCSVSRPLPSTRAPQGGRLPAAEPSPPGGAADGIRTPEIFRPHPVPPSAFPRRAPDFAQGHPRRTVSVLVALVAPFPRAPRVAVGDSLFEVEMEGKWPVSR